MNNDFKEYVERYCKKHKCTFEEALQHKVVVDVGEYYQVSKHSPSTVQGDFDDVGQLQTQ